MFYHPVKIGNLTLDGNLFLAPVAGYSDCVFRYICKMFGANFSYTEMVSAEAIVRGNIKTCQLIKRTPVDDTLIKCFDKENILSLMGDAIDLNNNFKQVQGYKMITPKYAVQLFGSDPVTMARAARIVLNKTNCECIDINAGCPVKKITKTGAGSALMGDLPRLGAIIFAIKKEIDPVPVTVKIRLGLSSEHENYLDAAKVALDNGAAAITLHARTASQGYEGAADWGKLKKLVEYVHNYNNCTVAFGSGDLYTPQDAKKMIEETRVDGVMFARGAQGNPFIFSETRALLQKADSIHFNMDKTLLNSSGDGEDPKNSDNHNNYNNYNEGNKKDHYFNLKSEYINSDVLHDTKTQFNIHTGTLNISKKTEDLYNNGVHFSTKVCAAGDALGTSVMDKGVYNGELRDGLRECKISNDDLRAGIKENDTCSDALHIGKKDIDIDTLRVEAQENNICSDALHTSVINSDVYNSTSQGACGYCTESKNEWRVGDLYYDAPISMYDGKAQDKKSEFDTNILDKADGYSLKDKLRVALLEVKMLSCEIGEHGACVEMRKRFSSYIKGVAGGAALRRASVEANSVEDYKKILEKCYSENT